MNLYTRCPQCETTFRVTTQQLQASGGQVRCGHCQNLFDAFATLTAKEPQSVPREPSAATPASPVGATAGEPNAQANPVAAAASALAGPKLPAPDPAASLYEWEFRMPQARRHGALWSVLSFVTVLILLLQAAYVFRMQIAVLLPQTKSYYQHFCDAAGCVIGPPKLPNFLHIAASDLKVPDPLHPSEIQLSLSVRNRAPVDLAYPAFELTLTDPGEAAIARRVFLPADYLPTGPQSAGLKAGSELPIQLYLDTGTLRAAGYRLYLFYP